MSVFTSVEVLVFAMLIMAFLQFVPGVFALLYHSLTGKFSRARAEHTALFFVLGAETAVTLMFVLVFFIVNTSSAISTFLEGSIFAWIASGILVFLGLFFALNYFRRGEGTQLFISRKMQAQIYTKIAAIKTRGDAFLLGFTALIPELLFTIPLILLSTLAIMKLGDSCLANAALALVFVLVTISPVLCSYIFLSRKNTLADLMRIRFKNKPFVRFFVPLMYFLIATVLIMGVSV